jgi:hypothetical protein
MEFGNIDWLITNGRYEDGVERLGYAEPEEYSRWHRSDHTDFGWDDGPAPLRRPFGVQMRASAWLRVPESGDVEAITRRPIKHLHEENHYLESVLPKLYNERTWLGTAA